MCIISSKICKFIYTIFQISNSIEVVDGLSGAQDFQQKTCAAIVGRFLELDIENDDIFAFVKAFVASSASNYS